MSFFYTFLLFERGMKIQMIYKETENQINKIEKNSKKRSKCLNYQTKNLQVTTARGRRGTSRTSFIGWTTLQRRSHLSISRDRQILLRCLEESSHFWLFLLHLCTLVINWLLSSPRGTLKLLHTPSITRYHTMTNWIWMISISEWLFNLWTY